MALPGKFWRRWLALGWFAHLFFAAGVGAQTPIIVTPEFSESLIIPAVLRDPAHALTLDSVRKPAHFAEFRTVDSPYFTVGADPSNWWLHFKVRNTLPRVKTLILRLNRKNFDEFHLYQQTPDSQLLALGKVGADLHDDDRFMLTNGYHFAVTLQPGENEFWALACNRIGSMHLGLSLRSPDNFALLNRHDVLLFGLFCGIMAVSMLFAVLFFVQTRDALYLFYLVYVVNILLREAYNFSADFNIFPVVQRNVTSLLIATTYGLFYRRFLQLKKLHPVFDRVVIIYAFGMVIVAIVVWALAKNGQGQVLQHAFRLVDALNLAFTLLAIGIALRYYGISVRAKITAIAFLPLAMAFIAILLRNMNLIPNYPFISNAVMWGFILEVLVFTIGFSQWSRQMEYERNNLQWQLEVEQRDRQMAVQVAEQRVKDRIARDLHDDVAASMSGIRILSQVAHNQMTDKTSPVAKLVEQINRSAQTTLESISDLIWAVKPHPDYLNDMADRMREYANRVLQAKGVAYQLHIPRDLPVLDLDLETRRNIYLIFKEAANNALKYSDCHNMDISLQLDETGNLCFVLTDDGRGFDLHSAGNGNGLGNMAQRARDIGAQLEIVSTPEAGTRVAFLLPLNR